MKKILLKFKAIPIGIGVLIFSCLLPTISQAQFTKLYDKGGPGSPILVPNGGINVLYAMTGGGGGYPNCDGNCGSIFKINTDGTGYSNIWTFQGVYYVGTGDGANPYGSLVFDGTYIYGMTEWGGPFIDGQTYYNYGTTFNLNADGTGYNGNIYDFYPASKGVNPYGSLIEAGGNRYGMTNMGGGNGKGTIWKSSVGSVHDFAGSDGAYPYGDLISDGTYLYGMTPRGGQGDKGVVFKYNLSTSAYNVLLEFGNTTTGAHPYGSLIFIGGTLYGMTKGDDTTTFGNIFKITTSGIYTHLHAFNNPNGISPFGSLIYHKGFLFGMTKYGGTSYAGTLFKADLNGSNCVDLVNFGGANGSNPNGSLCSDGTYLYGMTSSTIFKYNYCSTAPLTISESPPPTYNGTTWSTNVYPTITIGTGTSITAMTNQIFKYSYTATLNGTFSSGSTGKTLSITPTPCP